MPDSLDAGQLKRELAIKGYHVVKSYFEYDPITNVRNGAGFVQVRAGNPRYIEDLRREIDSVGLQLARKQTGFASRNTPSKWRL